MECSAFSLPADAATMVLYEPDELLGGPTATSPDATETVVSAEPAPPPGFEWGVQA